MRLFRASWQTPLNNQCRLLENTQRRRGHIWWTVCRGTLEGTVLSFIFLSIQTTYIILEESFCVTSFISSFQKSCMKAFYILTEEDFNVTNFSYRVLNHEMIMD